MFKKKIAKIKKIFKRKKRGKRKKIIALHGKGLLILKLFLFFIIIFSLGAGTSYFYQQHRQEQKDQLKELSQIENDIYVLFLSEVYTKIQENYWNKVSDLDLSKLFKLGAENLTQESQILSSNDKNGLGIMFKQIIEGKSEEEKKNFSIQLADLVLKNLAPFGRSQLYSSANAKNLQNRIENVNPETNEVEPTVSSETIAPPETSTPSGTIASSDASPEILNSIFYIHLKKFGAHTFEEFQQAANSVDDNEEIDTLILDLRGNIGGSIDLLPYFLGPFIGNNQYAYEFLHQAEQIPFKTQIGWLPSLVRYKKVVILIDEKTQSSAEVAAACLKKYNVGVLVGRKTRGWGTIEKVFNIEQQIDAQENYSMFLVHSLSIRDDGQLIEGNGVVPVISMDSPTWEDQLFAYFHYKELGETIKNIWDTPPGTVP